MLGGAVFGAAEPPTWEEVSAPLYAVAHHSYPVYFPTKREGKQGIWAFDPMQRSWRRVAPLLYNAFGLASPLKDGQGGILKSLDERLVFEGVGAWLETDPISGAVLRRYHPGYVSGAWGWHVVGPGLGSLDASRMGLAPGFYGFPRCQAFKLGFLGSSLPGCSSLSFPAGAPPTTRSLISHLVRYAGQPGQLQQIADLSSLPASVDGSLANNFEALSVDPERTGFWIATRYNVAGQDGDLVFIPAQDGVVRTDLWQRTAIPAATIPDQIVSSFVDPLRAELYLVTWDYRGVRTKLIRTDLGVSNIETILDADDFETDDPFPWTLTRLPSQPPATFEQTIPIVVRAAGKGGTWWSSELWLYNPADEPTAVTVRRIVKPTVSKTVELPAHGSRRIGDVVTWLGGGPGPVGDGTTHDGLVLRAPYRLGAQVVATSRVWTPALDPDERAKGGTMGQGVPAVPGTTGYSNHIGDQPLIQNDPAPGLTEIGRQSLYVLDQREPGRFRHNLGLANDRGEPVTLSLWWGSSLNDWGVMGSWPEGGFRQDVTVAAHSVKIVNLENLFPAAVQTQLPSVVAVTGDISVPIWFSMVDNRTGDGIHVPYSLWWWLGDPDTHVAMPAAAHLPGAKGTVWRTDLYLPADEVWSFPFVPQWWGDEPFARFHPAWGTSCGGSGSLDQRLKGVLPSQTTWFDPRGFRSLFPDVVHLFDACAQDENVRGTLEVRSSSWMSGFGRTYTTRADGGTYGEMMPFYPPYGWPVQHFAGLEIGPRFRLNLGLYNGDPDHAIRHRLTLYAADGTKVAEREVTLAPHASVQERLETMLGRPLDSFAEGTYGLSVLPLDDTPNGVQGRSWAYVSMVDNVTGDPTNWW